MEKESPKNIGSAFWEDSFKVWGSVGPFLSGIYWIYKWFGEPPPVIKELSWAWGMAPLLIWVIVAYARRWKAFKGIAGQIAPQFVLSLPDDGISQTPEKLVNPTGRVLSSYNATYVRICVESNCKTNVNDCTAHLVSILKKGDDVQFNETEFRDPMQLIWSHSNFALQKTLKYGVRNYVAIIKSRENSNKLEFEVEAPLKYQNILQEVAIYRFKVVVNGGGVSKSITVDVNWQGRWDKIKVEETQNAER